MKKRIVISIALLVIICLALTGCGQKGNNTTKPDNTPAQTNTEPANNDKQDNPGDETKPNDPNTTVDPSDNSGLYTYELHGGITITCSTNVWDYIDGNNFDFRAMAHDLGFIDDLNEMPECQGFTHDFDGQNVIVGFAGDERTNLSDPHFPLVAITRYGTDGGVREIFVNYYYDTGAEYTINGSGPKLSFDSIPIVAYILENFSLDNKDPFSDLFEAYRVPKEQQTASWKEYTLP